MGIIYCCKNKLDGKLYIGQTKQTLERRMNQHKFYLGKTRSYINYALQKYGFDNFEIIKFVVPNNCLNLFEKELIKRLNTLAPNGYNLQDGGVGKRRLCKSTKKIISKKISEGLKGIPKSIEHRKNLSKANLAYYSNEKNHSWSYGMRLEDREGEKNPKAKSIYCFETNKIYKCIKYAAEELNINYNNLRNFKYRKNGRVCRYHFKFFNSSNLFALNNNRLRRINYVLFS